MAIHSTRSKPLTGLLLSICIGLAGCSSTQTISQTDNSDLYNGQRALAYQSKTDRASILELNQEAELALRSGNTDQATFYLIQSLAKDPSQYELYNRIGQIHLNMKSYALAQTAFERALTGLPDNIDTLTGLGLVHFHQKQRQQARAFFLKALAQDMERFPKLLAAKPSNKNESMTTETDEETMALSAPKTPLRVDSQSPYPTYNSLGIIADLDQRPEDAERYYYLAIRIQPKNPSAYNNLGYSYYLNDDWAKAESYYLKALDQNNDYKQAWRNLGLLYVRQEQYIRAVDAFSRLMTDAEAYNTVGYLCMVSHRYQIAEQYLQKAIDVSPAYFAKARENLKQNRQYLEQELASAP